MDNPIGELIEKISEHVEFREWDRVKDLIFQVSELSFNDGFEKGKELRHNQPKM